MKKHHEDLRHAYKIYMLMLDHATVRNGKGQFHVDKPRLVVGLGLFKLLQYEPMLEIKRSILQEYRFL